ncbi:MAG: IS630 family transposase [Spirochaetota bacterium]|nr:IS630 family transposase [Spirochaetota bacterium]
MPFQRKRAKLVLLNETREDLEKISRSRTASVRQVERAKIILRYSEGETVSAIARELNTNRPKVERCIDKALQFGSLQALEDLQRRGRPGIITPEAKAWLISIACLKPKDLGYSYELWTTRLLSKHIREHCKEAGHPSLAELARGTVSKILSEHDIKPHRITYYLERKDPDFEEKMTQVLHVYREIAVFLSKGIDSTQSMVATLSYDEKPGIQALSLIAPDLPPVPGKYPTVSRDYEYKRLGTVSLMAAIDLMTGKLWGQVVERHRSREFIDFLKMIDGKYPPDIKIRIVLDNHSAHTSKETRAYLKTVVNRFEFVFTPKHGSWLNLIESFFGKMANTMLRGIRVKTKEELKQRILQYLDEVNEEPVIPHWKYQPNDPMKVV